jgi:lysophospholipase L1-like esterase
LKSIIKKISSILLVSALVLTTPTLSSAKPLKKKDVDYVSLGDSLAAGQTPYREINLGYADFLKERMEQSQYEVDFTNFGVPGYTSMHLKNDVLTKETVRAEIKSADMITLDIGANDVLGALQLGPEYVAGAIGSVAHNLTVILATIDSLNPNVDVYVMGYYNPFPYRPQYQQEQLMQLMNGFNETIEAVSTLNGDVFVPTEEAIAEDPTLYIPNPADIHLSLDGYEVIAKEFWRALDKSNKIK